MVIETSLYLFYYYRNIHVTLPKHYLEDFKCEYFNDQ